MKPKITSIIAEIAHKIVRLPRAISGPNAGRKGSCTSDKCSSLDGVVGNACCRLSFTCPAVNKGQCGVYNFRPINCRSFPMGPQDLTLVNNCGYYWDTDESNKERSDQ